MKFTTADLLIAAGNSIKMQEASGIEPVCKCGGEIYKIYNVTFNRSAAKLYIHEFPLAVVEGKAVFEGAALPKSSGEI